MTEVLADAFYWIALANPADQWHDAVKKYSQLNPAVRLITTQEVLTEFLNFYAKAGNYRRKIVAAMCQQVLVHPNITVISQSNDSFWRGFDLYRQREDKGYSLTDCISMVICHGHGLQQVLTNDHHFRQEGLNPVF